MMVFRLVITYLSAIALAALLILTGLHWGLWRTDPAIRECLWHVCDDLSLDAMFFAEQGPFVLIWALVATFMVGMRGRSGE